MGIEKMLRMYLLQCWFNLSDEAVEDAIYASYAMRSFLKINFLAEQTPDATALLKFRHLLEKYNIGKLFFDAITDNLESHGYLMRGGSIIDATLIAAPSSTKNVQKQRDPEICQTQKGNQYYLGMKCNAAVDDGSGYVHSLETTPANDHDITASAKLLREDDAVVYGNSGYTGIEKRPEIVENPSSSKIEFRIARKFKSVQVLPENCPAWEKDIERRKSSVRSKVEHPFLIIKRFFGYAKVAYRGLMKNTGNPPRKK